MSKANPFTKDELDSLYNLVRDEHDDVMRGDWEAVKDDICDLHLLMHKLLKLQKYLFKIAGTLRYVPETIPRRLVIRVR